MHANMAKPEVGSDQGADCRIFDKRTVVPSHPKTHRVKAVQAIADQAQVLLYPELVIPLLLPRARAGVVVQEAPACLAVVVEDVDVGDAACGGVGTVDSAGQGIDGPDLLTSGGDQDSHVLPRVSYLESKGVPCAINAHPALVGWDRDGCRYRRNAVQELEVGRIGDVLLDISGGRTGREYERGGGDEGACC